MLLKSKYLASIAIFTGCLTLLNSSPSFAESKNVGAGESVSDQTISSSAEYDTLNIFENGLASNTTVNSGGTLNVETDGTANKAIINYGGKMNMAVGAKANNVTVNSLGALNVDSRGATIDGLTVKSGSAFSISTDSTLSNANLYGKEASISDKKAENFTIDYDSSLTVNNGGTAENTTVQNYGEMIVKSGGTSTNTTVNRNGTIVATESGAVVKDTTIKEGGGFDFSTDATVTGLTGSTGASLGTITDNKAQGVIVNKGSTLTVTSSEAVGNASGTKVSGGDMIVTNGASASDTTITDSGTLTVNNNGSASNANIVGSGTIDVNGSGSVVTATLTGSSDDVKAKINVSSGGHAESVTLNSYAEMEVGSGGETEKVIVGNGAVLNANGGNLTNTTVNNNGFITNNSQEVVLNGLTINNGGTFDLSTDATISGAIVNGSTMGEITEHIAQNLSVNNGSNLTVSANGAAVNTTIETGGNITAKETNASIDGLTLKNGATFDISTDATVKNITGPNGQKWTATIEDQTASGFQVTEGSTLTAADGGTITTSASTGGTLVAEIGGTIKDSAVGNNGTIRAEAGSTIDNVIIVAETGGTFDFSTNATITNTKIDDITISIENNHASNLKINSGSRLVSDSGGVADNIVVNGGDFLVNDGATANNSIVSSGTMTVDGGQATNTLVNNEGQAEVIHNGQFIGGTIGATGTLTISNNGSATGTNISTGGKIIVQQNGSADFINVGISGVLDVKSGGRADSATVNRGSVMAVETGGYANNTLVKQAAMFSSQAGGFLENLTAERGAILSLASGTNFLGSLTLDVDANASSSTLDFSNLFSAGNFSPSSLILNGGVNSAFKNRLVNESSDNKALILNGGNYTVSDDGQNGSIQLGGWDTISIANGTLKFESDIMMNGTNKELTIEKSATLDVSGTLDNVLKVTFDGNLINKGLIDMTPNGNSALDELIVNGNYEADTGAQMVMNVDAAAGTADKLTINGDVLGSTSVYLKSVSGKVANGNILLAEAPRNTTGSQDSFNVWRTEGSPFKWGTLFENNKWYTYVTNADRPTIVPETAAYYGLIDNTFMQTASLSANLRNNVSETEFRKTPCRVPSYLKYTNRICRSSRPVFSGWAAPVYSNANIKSPYNYTASVTGFDGGIDIISDGWTKLGLMGSYRNGSYKYSNSGDGYVLEDSARTTINSYLAGLYIRHDVSSWSIIAAAYTGILDIDIESDDGVKASTNGKTYGGTLDINYIYQNIYGARIEPGLRIAHTSVTIDGLADNVGKHSDFDRANRTEIEAGIRLAKRWEFPDARAEIFVKPSLVQTFNSGNTFELIEDRFLDSTEDRTFVKVEAGMNFDMIDNWNANLGAAYSTGSDYDNVSAGLGVRYKF